MGQMKVETRRSAIPPFIHQVWFDAQTDTNTGVPERYEGFVTGWKQLNPHMQYHFWNGQRIKRLFAIFPELAEFEGFFERVKKHIEKCDLARYMILYAYGGTYIDLDVICRKPLAEEVYEDREMLFFKEHPDHSEPDDGVPLRVYNGFVGSRPRQAVWVDFLTYIRQNYSPSKSVFANTGPLCLARYFAEHPAPDGWFVSPCFFCPYAWHGSLNPVCSEQDAENAYAHIVFKLGTDWQNGKTLTTKPVRKIQGVGQTTVLSRLKQIWWSQ